MCSYFADFINPKSVLVRNELIYSKICSNQGQVLQIEILREYFTKTLKTTASNFGNKVHQLLVAPIGTLKNVISFLPLSSCKDTNHETTSHKLQNKSCAIRTMLIISILRKTCFARRPTRCL